jgi:hypothetical protein
MRLLTKVSRKLVVFGFAGLGVYKAWELLSANSSGAREQALRVKSRVGGAVRQAESDVKDASQDAAESVLDASRVAVAEVAEAVADAALGGSPAEPAPASREATASGY